VSACSSERRSAPSATPPISPATCLGGLAVAVEVHGDPCALGRERPGGGGADAARPARDEDAGAVEAEVHPPMALIERSGCTNPGR
jgi:hypothetical protein